MYILTMSKDEFIICLSDFLEEGFLSRLTAAHEFSLLAVETSGEVVIIVFGNKGAEPVVNLDSMTLMAQIQTITALSKLFRQLDNEEQSTRCEYVVDEP